MDNAKYKVLKMIEKNRNEIIVNTQEIIRYPSVLGEEKDAQMYFSSILKKLSFDVDMWEPSTEDMKINPDFLAAREDYKGSPNVAGTLKGKGGGRSILLNGHIDVVPGGDNDWNDSPWSGKLEDGKIYGRGACDMKGGIIANVMAVKAIMDSGKKPEEQEPYQQSAEATRPTEQLSPNRRICSCARFQWGSRGSESS